MFGNGQYTRLFCSPFRHTDIPVGRLRHQAICYCTVQNGLKQATDLSLIHIYPVETAKIYDKAGADELVFLDITASSDRRGIMLDVVRRTAEQVFIPFTVGGGIRTVEDFRDILAAGADKISINSPAIEDPTLISRAAERFGSQCVVCLLYTSRCV